MLATTDENAVIDNAEARKPRRVPGEFSAYHATGAGADVITEAKPSADLLTPDEIDALKAAGFEFGDDGYPRADFKDGAMTTRRCAAWPEVAAAVAAWRRRSKQDAAPQPQPADDGEAEAELAAVKAEAARIVGAINSSAARIAELRATLSAAREADAAARADARLKGVADPKRNPKIGEAENELATEQAVADELRKRHAEVCSSVPALRAAVIRNRHAAAGDEAERIKGSIADLESRLAAERGKLTAATAAVKPLARGDQSALLAAEQRIQLHVLKVLAGDAQFPWYRSVLDVLGDPLAVIDRVRLADLMATWRDGIEPKEHGGPARVWPRLVFLFVDGVTGSILKADVAQTSIALNAEADVIQIGTSLEDKNGRVEPQDAHCETTLIELHRVIGAKLSPRIREYVKSLIRWDHNNVAEVERGIV
jgi:hypothetical protein